MKESEKLRNNDKIKGIYIEAGAFASDSYASMQALRKHYSISRRIESGLLLMLTPIHRLLYYLSSVADKVYLNPQGQIDWRGLASEPVFIKDLLAEVRCKDTGCIEFGGLQKRNRDVHWRQDE